MEHYVHSLAACGNIELGPADAVVNLVADSSSHLLQPDIDGKAIKTVSRGPQKKDMTGLTPSGRPLGIAVLSGKNRFS